MLRRSLMIVALIGVLSIGCECLYAQVLSSSNDKKFLQQNFQAEMTEMEIATLALQKGSDSDVKEFAQHVLKNQKMLRDNMQPFFGRAGIQPGDALDFEHQRLYDRLKILSGEQFDTEYVKASDKGHHALLNAFRQEIVSTQDQRIKAILQAEIAVIVEDTAKIDDICARMGMMPSGTEGPSRQ